MKKAICPGIIGALLLFSVTDARAEARQLADLADLSLEQLTKITVTSASRREERLIAAAASLFVINQEDIRRSGATSIPEALRLAPNLHVARADNNQYAITARGFNNILANKLLVLIDGRIVYSPLFSGVFWEAQDVVLDEVERIEVISGPGATLWGANAVNGVINIITLPASRRQGTLVKAGAGNFERGAGVRHGTTFGDDGHIAAFLKYIERDGRRVATGAEIGDDARTVTGGVRAEWGPASTHMSMQAQAYHGEVELGPMRTFSGAHVLGKWSRVFSADSNLIVQAYYDRTDRRHETTFKESLDTFDLEMQHAWKPLAGHLLVWGGGVRNSRDDVENSAAQAFIPADRSLRWSNAFVQDDVALGKAVTLTLGIKAERNPYTGTEWLPNARLAWVPRADHLVWGALSRAVRAPSRIDRELFIPGQAPFFLGGSNLFDSEVAKVAEIGYRAQLSPGTSLSATLFHHEYPNLRSVRLLSGTAVFANDIEGRLTGVEAWGSWRLTPEWRLSGGFVVQDIDRKVRAGGVDLGGMASLGNDPESWALLRSSWSPRSDIDVDVSARHIGALQTVVPAYTVADVRVAWRVRPDIELSLTAQNALGGEHIEWSNRGLVERTIFFKVVWRS